MFINRDSETDYTADHFTKMFGFDPPCNSLNINFLGQLSFIFLKSVGKRGINLYNYASGEGNIGYYKRFLFNLGDKPVKVVI